MVHPTNSPAPALPVCPPSVWSGLSLRTLVYPVQVRSETTFFISPFQDAGKKKKTATRSGNHSVAFKKKTTTPAVQLSSFHRVSVLSCPGLAGVSAVGLSIVHIALQVLSRFYFLPIWESLPNGTGYVLCITHLGPPKGWSQCSSVTPDRLFPH